MTSSRERDDASAAPSGLSEPTDVATPPDTDEPPGLHRAASLPAIATVGDCGALERFEPTQPMPLLADRFRVPMPSDGLLPDGTPTESRDGSVAYAKSIAEAPTIDQVHELMDLAGRIHVHR